MANLAESARRATYADVAALPEGVYGEILAGELVATPRPAGGHARASSVLGAVLGHAFDLGTSGPGGWWITDEPELSLAADPSFDPVVADIAGWRITTMPEHPDTAQFHVVPDWVCEVVSPSTARRDRVLKLPYYARAGVQHAWLVDPLARSLEVYRLDEDSHYVLAQTAADKDVVRAEPFEAIEIDLALLWRRTHAASQ